MTNILIGLGFLILLGLVCLAIGTLFWRDRYLNQRIMYGFTVLIAIGAAIVISWSIGNTILSWWE